MKAMAYKLGTVFTQNCNTTYQIRSMAYRSYHGAPETQPFPIIEKEGIDYLAVVVSRRAMDAAIIIIVYTVLSLS